MSPFARLLMNPYGFPVDNSENKKTEQNRKKARTARKKAQNHKRRHK